MMYGYIFLIVHILGDELFFLLFMMPLQKLN